MADLFYLHWADTLAGPGLPPVARSAAYNSLAEALEQAIASDGLEPRKITSDETGDQVVADKAAIQAYADAKAKHEEKRAAAVDAADVQLQKAVADAAAAVGS